MVIPDIQRVGYCGLEGKQSPADCGTLYGLDLCTEYPDGHWPLCNCKYGLLRHPLSKRPESSKLILTIIIPEWWREIPHREH